jgi:predicted dehydrogenase
MTQRFHRRRLLQTAAGAVAAAGAWPLPAFTQPKAADDKLNLAVIGVAGRGASNLKGVEGENIVALCDVDEKNLARAAERFPRAQQFVDFRKMLEAVERQVDAVVVSTPDHTHAPAAVMAMRLGKHCYCEKPLTHSVYEARTVTEAARQKKVATQIGTQIHAETNYRRVVELVQAGAIGATGEVHVWVNVSYHYGDRPADTPPVPEGLHWDLWLGPAPERPYHPAYVPGQWRKWWDFGTGGLGDFGCHYMDLPFWALKLRYPTSIEAEGPPVHPESTPPWVVVRYEYPAREDLCPLQLTWYDGGRQPPQLAELLREMEAHQPKPEKSEPGERGRKPPRAAWPSGVLFVGDKGMIIADYSRHMLLPRSKFADFQPPPPFIPDSIGHHEEWIQACKTGSPTTCRFDYSGPLTEAALLGMVAYRAGEKLSWDAANLKATNSTNAERYIKRQYRAGWTL